MELNNIQITRIDPNVSFVAPTRMTEGSVGYDLYIPGDPTSATIRVAPNEITTIPLNFRIRVPDGYHAEIRQRSSTFGQFITMPGVIDTDYTGEVKVMLQHNGLTDKSVRLAPNTRFAQMVLYSNVTPPITEVSNEQFADVCMKTTRGDGGFGSTGQN